MRKSRKTAMQRARALLQALPIRERLAWLLLFPASILWLEVVLKASTTGGWWPPIVFISLFALAGGLLAQALCSLSPKPYINRLLKLTLLAVLGVVYGVQYFVYGEFKMFYDLATVTKGASGAAHGFSDQIALLLFNPSGIGQIIFFMTPALVYARYLVWNDPAEKANIRSLSMFAGASAATHLLAVAIILSTGTLGLTYSTRYSYPSSIQSFGMLTSLRKEIVNSAKGTSATGFSTSGSGALPESRILTESVETDPSESEQDTKEAGTTLSTAAPNALDIDFSALASTTDGTWADIDRYVASQSPSLRNDMTGIFEGYNLVFISAEALSAEAIREDTTPTLWRMATKGIQFTDYYQPASAGTTGGEYLNLFGMLPTDGGASVIDTASHNNYLTMGFTLNRLGYDGWAFHNNDYTYYSRDLTHNQLGYNHGYMGYGNGIEQWVTSQWPESDLEMVKGTWENLYGTYGDEEWPFNVYYMSVSGHSLYSPDINAMSEKWWSEVKDLPYSESVRAYLAANIDLDRAMEYLIGQLEERGIADRTVIVIAADHFPYGLDDESLGDLPVLSELYGHEVSDILDRDHNRLIIWCGSLEEDEPLVVDTPTSSMDILPTLLNLFGADWDSRLLPGRDVFSDRNPLVFDINYNWKTNLGTYFSWSDEFAPAAGATVPDGYVDQMNTIVADKINYCYAVLETDYYRHVFGEPEDVDAAYAAGKASSGGYVRDENRWGEEIVHRFRSKHNL